MPEQSLSGGPGELRDRDNPAIQWVTFHLGQLVIQVLFIATIEKVLITIPREYEPYLISIWPLVGTDVVWPPPNVLDDNGFESLVRIALT
jgi:hypothetical protein